MKDRIEVNLELVRIFLLLPLFYFYFFTFTFYSLIVPLELLPWKIRVAFIGESQLRQSRAIQPTVYAEF